jgi:hypothetical protein
MCRAGMNLVNSAIDPYIDRYFSFFFAALHPVEVIDGSSCLDELLYMTTEHTSHMTA